MHQQAPLTVKMTELILTSREDEEPFEIFLLPTTFSCLENFERGNFNSMS